MLEGRVKMSDLCIGCGEIDVQAEHPLFEGGLCKHCKVREGEIDLFCGIDYLRASVAVL